MHGEQHINAASLQHSAIRNLLCKLLQPRQTQVTATMLHDESRTVMFFNKTNFYIYMFVSYFFYMTSVQNFTEIVLGKPLHRGLNQRGVAKYSYVGHVESYI